MGGYPGFFIRNYLTTEAAESAEEERRKINNCEATVYRSIIHIDIKDGKIWLQQNSTDQNPAEELVAMGVPREDIILGLQPPYKRQYSDYGVA